MAKGRFYSCLLNMRALNEVEVLAILEDLWIFSCSFQGMLIIESNTSNSVSWMSSSNERPSELNVYFKEISNMWAECQKQFGKCFS